MKAAGKLRPWALSRMRKNIGFRPTGQVQFRAGREEIETGLRQVLPLFPFQPLVQLDPQPVKVKNVRGGIILLRARERFRAPIAHLLLFGEVQPQQILCQVLQPMAVRLGAHKTAGDLGAVDRGRQGTKGVIHGSNVKAAIVKQLQGVRIFQQGAEIGGLGLAFGDLHNMGIAIAIRQLHHAEPIAMRVQPHGLAIDRNGGAQLQAIRQVALVEVVGQFTRSFDFQAPARGVSSPGFDRAVPTGWVYQSALFPK